MKATFSKKNLMAALVPAAGISQTQNTYAPCDGLLFECPPDKRFGDYESSLNLKINLAIVLVFGVPLFFIFLGLIGQIPPDTVRAVGETCWDIFAATITAIFR